jgi:hypothetical protein
MRKSPAMHLLGKIVWFITAVASIGIGLLAFNYNLVETGIFSKLLQPYLRFFEYLVGAAGLISLIMFFMYCTTDYEMKK